MSVLPKAWKERVPPTVHLMVTFLLVAGAFVLDYARPSGRSFSILLIIPPIYAAWALRGRRAWIVYGLTLVLALIAPSLRAKPGQGRGVPTTRLMGIAVGGIMVGLMIERRRHLEALIRAGEDLETKVAARTAELRDLNQEYQRLLVAKSQFLSNMSHEIRTPLNGVLGMADLMAHTPMNATQRALLDDLRTSGHSLRGIVDDVLDLSRIEAGRLELEHAPFRLSTTMAEVEAMIRPGAMAKGLEVRVSGPGAAQDQVMGDGQRLRQVLINLAGNALKFTERGQIRIEVGEANGRFRFVVRDTGIGIAEEDQRRIFEGFTQVDGSRGRRYGGSGLGLAISRELVNLMGGEMGLESRVGAGSVFWFEVPLAQAAPEPAAEVGGRRMATVPAGLRVFVVEDHEVNRRLLEMMLELLGCRVTCAVDGEEALRVMAKMRFDLAFIDCHMPGLDGLETTRAIRRAEAGQDHRTKVIACSASVLREDRLACFEAGMDDFLAKPVSLEELQAIVERWSGTPARAMGQAAGY